MKRYSPIGIMIVIAAAVVLVLIFQYAARQNRADAKLTSFAVSRPDFLAESEHLEAVEVWAIPTGTAVNESEYIKIGTMKKTNDGTPQRWSLPLPVEPVLASQIFAKGIGADGQEAGRIALPFTSAAQLHEELWGEEEE